MDLRKIQQAIAAQDIDGWLFCDFHNREHIAYRILGLDINKSCSRRWFYFVPRRGAPVKLVHAIEQGALSALPGKTRVYAGWEALKENLGAILNQTGSPHPGLASLARPSPGGRGKRRVAMQYSPKNNIPTISLVDAGTIELVRSLGVEVVSSADLVQRLYSLVDDKRFKSHQKAGKLVQKIKDDAFALIINSLNRKKAISELDVQKFIMDRFEENNLTTNHGPIVAANEHAADPHFEPTAKNSKRFKKNDRVLIDLWAKLKTHDAVYYDITWCGFLGSSPPAEYVKRFQITMNARDAAINFVRDSLRAGKTIRGWEVDKVCRGVITDAGFGKYFVHRTGHSIDTSVHGEGANIDSLETQDDRKLIPGALFSIEPGIYKDGIGVRSEVDVYISLHGDVCVEGAVQQELILMR